MTKKQLEKLCFRGTDCAKVIEIIETRSLAGDGTYNNTIRVTTQYWSRDGVLLATRNNQANEDGDHNANR